MLAEGSSNGVWIDGAVFVHSVDADLRGMQGFTGTRAHFAGIVSLLPGFPSHLWEGNAIIKALNCSPKVLQTVYALMGDNASHSLKGVRGYFLYSSSFAGSLEQSKLQKMMVLGQLVKYTSV